MCRIRGRCFVLVSILLHVGRKGKAKTKSCMCNIGFVYEKKYLRCIAHHLHSSDTI
jgi:hypothetical protein